MSLVTLRTSALCALPLLLVSCRSAEPRETPRVIEDPETGQSGIVAPQTPAHMIGAPQRPTPPPRADQANHFQPTQQPAQAAPHPGLRNPSLATEQAPATYAVELNTTKGPVVIDVTRSWAPNGADRFYNLVRVGYFTDVAFFRVIEGFMAQGGLSGDPALNRVWRAASIPDDPVRQSNLRGMVTFATSGPDSRSNQFFINFGNNARLDDMGFSPFGRVRDMAAVDGFFKGYGEGAPRGRGPNQALIQEQGNTYLRAQFPNLDYIRSARIL